MGELLLGTSSWSEPTWVGPFYPVGTKPGAFLHEYGRCFPVVEVDSTYYAVPAPTTVDGWVRKTPQGFRMAAKFPRGIVHGGAGPAPDADVLLLPERVAAETDAFLEAMRRLGPRCGPLLLQFPYFARTAFADAAPFLERLERFLESLPDEFRYAVEVRNRDWLDERLTALLRRRGAALTLVDMARMPHPAVLARKLDVLTTDFAYARLIGDRRQLDALTDRWDRVLVDQDDRLDAWVPLLERAVDEVATTYVFANNHYAGHGPGTIRALGERLGLDVGRPRDDGGGQRTLFG